MYFFKCTIQSPMPLTFSCAAYLLTKQESWQHFRHLGMEEASSVVDGHSLIAPVQPLSWGSMTCGSATVRKHGTVALGETTWF